jgi:hypothetical protein
MAAHTVAAHSEPCTPIGGSEHKSLVSTHVLHWRCRYNAGTPMGHSMEDKVLKPLLHRKLKDRTLRKPLLVRLLIPS